LPFKCSDPEGHNYRYFLAWTKANGATSRPTTRATGMPSRLPAHRGQARSQEPGRRRSTGRVEPSRKGGAATAPLFPMAYRRSDSTGSNPSRLQVTGCGLGVAGSPLLTPALLFAFCFPARRGHELWSNRIRNRFLQNPIDFRIVLGGQLPSVCFLHTLQLFA